MEKIDAALDYMGLGYSVIPLEAGGKRPLVPWGEAMHRCAVAHEIVQWWTRWPDANVGIVTGKRSRIIVLDADAPAAAEHLLNELQETAHYLTPRGAHFWLQHPGGYVANRFGLMLGVDLKGDGAYVAVPPSTAEGRTSWEWVRPLAQGVAPCPAWLLDLIVR